MNRVYDCRRFPTHNKITGWSEFIFWGFVSTTNFYIGKGFLGFDTGQNCTKVSVLLSKSQLCVPFLDQDFADIVSQPSLEGPADTGLKEEEEGSEHESSETSPLSTTSISLLIRVHQRLCLGYAQSLWYRSTMPANHNQEHIKTLVSSYQIAAPLISFYHLIGQWSSSLLLKMSLKQKSKM